MVMDYPKNYVIVVRKFYKLYNEYRVGSYNGIFGHDKHMIRAKMETCYHEVVSYEFIRSRG